MTSVSRGPVMECCLPAIPPQVLPTGRHPFCSHAGTVAEWPVTSWSVGERVESRFKGQWLRNQSELTQLLSITARCVHFKLDKKKLTSGSLLLCLHLPILLFLLYTRQRKVMSVFRHSSRGCVVSDAALSFCMASSNRDWTPAILYVGLN